MPSSAPRPPGETRWANLFATLRQLAGMPNYAAHLDHLRRSHPESPIPTEGQFYDDFIRARYGDSATRCC